jgi:hypothetical protein
MPSTFMKLCHIFIAASAVAGVFPTSGSAAPAKFWLSYSSVDPASLAAPAVTGIENGTRYLYIWAQPETVGAGEYHVTENRFRTMHNFSLDLVTDVPGDASDAVVDFVDGSFKVYNPLLDGKYRFQFVYDSHTTTGPLLSAGSALDGIEGMQGFSVSPGSANGIGHSPNYPSAGCHPSDPYCAATPQQSPAWLVASVGVRTTAPSGLSKIHLQIGENGMSYGTTQATQVAFGANGQSLGPIYDASNASHRGISLPGDDPDVQFSAASAAAIQLSTWTGGSGLWTEAAKWSGNLVPASFVRNAKLPSTLGNNIVTVNGQQLANETMVDGGRLHIAGGASLASAVTVASGGSVSGQGWVGGDLVFNAAAPGSFAIDSTSPLQVAGSAQLNGAQLRLTSNFSPPAGEFEILRTSGTIGGGFAATPGLNLGGGLFLQSLRFTPAIGSNSALAQISGVSGDYNGDGTVDTRDYIVWRKSVGCNVAVQACLSDDGNHDRVIDQGDYAVWRAHFGQSASGTSTDVNQVAVPELASMLLLVPGLLLASTSRQVNERINKLSRFAATL